MNFTYSEEQKSNILTEKLPIYELNIRQFSEKGDFNSIIPELPRLKKMGIGIIWLMPIHPIGEKKRKGKLGSYYSVKDYLTVNEEFGTEDDFKKLVQAIHDQDMYVIIDWVANHTAWDNEMINEHPEWYTRDKKGKIQTPVEDWMDVADLNYDNSELRAYMTQALASWIKNFNIDGFRCDVAEMVPIDFWKEAIPTLREIKPVFMLAEGAKKELLDAGFNMVYSWKLYHLLNDINKDKEKWNKIDSLYRDDLKTYGKSRYIMRFITNHDENSWNGTIEERLAPHEELYTILYLTFPGRPLVYSGQEAGMNKRLDFFEKDPILWKETVFSKIFNAYLPVYREHSALNRGNFKLIKSPSPKVVCFRRTFEDKEALIVLNFSKKTVKFELKTDVEGNFQELFSGRSTNNIKEIAIPADSYQIWLN